MLLWNKELETGVDSIDVQHQALLQLINSLSEKHSGDKIEAELDYFFRYCSTQFSNEEELMLLCEYPGFTQHRSEHVFYLTKIHELKKLIHAESLATYYIKNFLANWLASHIRKTDIQAFKGLDR